MVDINLGNDTHFKIQGYDRPMRSTVIVSDLVRSLLGSGGEIELGRGCVYRWCVRSKEVTTRSGQRFGANMLSSQQGNGWGSLRILAKLRSSRLTSRPSPAVTPHHG